MEQHNIDKIDDTLELEQEGLKAFNSKKYGLAIKFFRRIIDLDSAFEHGNAFFYLANALEITGDIEAAEKAFIKAIEYEDTDPDKVGGYASFLYRHRSAEEAFKAYLKWVLVAKQWNDLEELKRLYPIIFELGEKMDWSKEKVQKAIDEA